MGLYAEQTRSERTRVLRRAGLDPCVAVPAADELDATQCDAVLRYVRDGGLAPIVALARVRAMERR